MKANKKIILYGVFAIASLVSVDLRAAESEDLSSSMMGDFPTNVTEDLSAQIVVLQERIRQIEHEKLKLEETIGHHEELMRVWEAELKVSQEQVTVGRQHSQRFEATNTSLREAVKQLEEEIKETHAFLEEQKSLVENQRKSIIQLTKENARIADLEGGFAGAKAAQEKAQAALRDVEGMLRDQAREFEKMRKELSDAQKTVASQKTTIEQLTQRLALAEQDQLDSLNRSTHRPSTEPREEGSLAAELAAADVVSHQERDTLHSRLQEMEQQLEQKTAQLEELHRELTVLNESHNRCGATKAEVARLKEVTSEKDVTIVQLRNIIEETHSLREEDKVERETLDQALREAREALRNITLTKDQEISQKDQEINQLYTDFRRKTESHQLLLQGLKESQREVWRQNENQHARNEKLAAELAQIRVQLDEEKVCAQAMIAQSQHILLQKEEEMKHLRLTTEQTLKEGARNASVGEMALKTEIEVLRKHVNDVDREIRKVQAQSTQKIKELETTIAQKEAEIKKSQHQIQTLTLKNSQLEREGTQLQAEIMRLKVSLQEMTAQYDTEVSVLQRKIQDTQQEMSKKIAQLTDLQGVMSGQNTQNETLKRNLAVVQQRSESLEAQLTGAQQLLNERDHLIGVLNQNIKEYTLRLRAFENQKSRVADLERLRRSIEAIVQHQNFKEEAQKLLTDFNEKIRSLNDQEAQKSTAFKSHLQSSGSSVLARALGAVASHVAGATAAAAPLEAGLTAGLGGASVLALENRAQRLHRETKEKFENEIRALQVERGAYEVAVRIIQIAQEMQTQIEAAAATQQP
jgi:chromosome segregation ATPase